MVHEPRRPPRYARPFVVLLVGALIGCAAVSAQAWPFTAWRLFSTLRTDEQHGWAATVVAGSDGERAFPAGNIGAGSRGFRFLMNGFSRRTPAQRDAICRTWVAEGTSYLGRPPVAVRIYALTVRLSDGVGDHAARPQRTLRWTCTSHGAHATA